MEKFFLICCFACVAFTMPIFADMNAEVQDENPEQSEFFPPDIVPHPIFPWDMPSGPGEPFEAYRV